MEIAELEKKVLDLISEKNRQAKRIAELEEKIEKGIFNVQQITVGTKGSPYQVIISGAKESAGIWINGKNGEGIVSIYNNNVSGPVVGVWAKTQDGPLDVALAAKHGASIQLYDRSKDQIFFVDTANLKPTG